MVTIQNDIMEQSERKIQSLSSVTNHGECCQNKRSFMGRGGWEWEWEEKGGNGLGKVTTKITF